MCDLNWNPPPQWLTIHTVEMHTGGEPLRIPVSGMPKILGNSILEKRKYFRDNYDHLRKGLMFEPRGHADMYGAILSPATLSDADYDVFFIHNEGYSTMCGHAIIALTKYIIDARKRNGENESREVTFNTPAGLVVGKANLEKDNYSFVNVPSYVFLRDQRIHISGIGDVNIDIAFGGAYYAIVEVGELNINLGIQNYNKLIDYGRLIKKNVIKNFRIDHPVNQDLGFLYGTIFTGHPISQFNHSQNVCVFADGEIDRSATGTGVSARAALLFSRGKLSLNHPITIESILATTLTVEAIEQVNFYNYMAIVPRVSGEAFYTGKSQFCFDPNDPLKSGFIFR